MRIRNDVQPPTINMDRLASLNPATRRQEGDALFNAMNTWGCFVLEGQQVPDRVLVQQLQLYCLLAYSLSDTTKLALNGRFGNADAGIYKMLRIGEEVYPGQRPNGREILDLTNGAPLLMHGWNGIPHTFIDLPALFAVYDAQIKYCAWHCFRAILERSGRFSDGGLELMLYKLVYSSTRTWGCTYPTIEELSKIARQMTLEWDKGGEAHTAFKAVGHHLDSGCGTTITPGWMAPENATLFLMPGQEGFGEDSDPEDYEWAQISLREGQMVMNFGKYLHLIAGVPYVGWHMATKPGKSLHEISEPFMTFLRQLVPADDWSVIEMFMHVVGKILLATFFNGDPSIEVQDPDTGEQTTIGAMQRKFRAATGVEG